MLNRHINNLSWELRSRYVVAFAWIVGITFMKHLSTITATCFFAFFFLMFLGISSKRIFRRLLYVLPFLSISFITLLFSDGWPITRAAMAFSLLVVARIVACVAIVHLVAFDDIRNHLNCFQALKCPNALTSTLYLTQRYVHVIARQYTAMRNALVSRLFSSPFQLKTLDIYGQMIGGMTIKTIDRSEQIRKAMESRGFYGKIPTEQPLSIRKSDCFKSFVAVLFLFFVLFAERQWF